MRAKTWYLLGALLIALLLGTFIYDIKKSFADTGREAAVRIEVGSYVQSRTITMSATAATAIGAANNNRPDMTCFNNSAYALYLSSNVANTYARVIGFPVLSSATFKLGSLSGETYGTLEVSGVGDVRCMDGLVL